MSEYIENGREQILARLSLEAPIFTESKRRAERAAGLDANLNAERKRSADYIDRLLDKFNVVDLSSIPVAYEPGIPDNVSLGEA
jgi:hypothetical protein